jgi:nitroreductase
VIRAYRPDPVDPDHLLRVLAAGRRAPAAGNTDGRAFLVLEGAATAHYWNVSLPAARRTDFPWPGLLDAPVLIVVLTRPDAYVMRYGEPDKVRSGLGEAVDAWSVPYWFVDGGMASQAILSAARAEGLGACFFGLFDHEVPLLREFGVPEGWRAVGTIALGHPDLSGTDLSGADLSGADLSGADRDGADPDRLGRARVRTSRSAARGRPPLESLVHRGRW